MGSMRGWFMGVAHCRSGSLAGLRHGQRRCHFQRGEGRASETQPRRDQGHRRGRLHLRPADRDELRGDVRVRGGRNFGPIQGAVQSDQERSARLHLQGHGGHDAQQRHAVFLDVAWTCAPNRWCCLFRPSRNHATTQCSSPTATPSTTVTSAAAPPAMNPATIWLSAPIGKVRRPPASRRCSTHPRSFSGDLSHAALQCGGHAERGKDPSRLQSAAAVRVSEAARATGASGDRLPKINEEMVKTQVLGVPRLRAAVRSAWPGRRGNPREACQHRHRPGQEI